MQSLLKIGQEMKAISLLVVCGLLVGTIVGSGARHSETTQYWPAWRGPLATGVAPEADPPLEWSETTNIRWKVEIPGRGSGSPIIWENRLYLLTAVSVGEADSTAAPPLASAGRYGRWRRGPSPVLLTHQFKLIAYDRADGRVVWERVAREEAPHEPAHPQNGTWASSSAATDGKHLYAYFGSRGLYCYTLDGELVWERDFGQKQMRNHFGEGTTPVLHGNTIVVVWDHQGDSFVFALDKRTGNERWRAPRDEIDTWATPVIVEHRGRHQVVIGAMDRVVSYDLETGEIVWESDGLTMNPIPSPVAADGFVYLTSGYRGNDLKAVRLSDASGDITGTAAIVWSLDRDTPYVPSPLLYDDTLYIIKSNSGILSAFEAKTGAPYYQTQRLRGVPNVFASPVGAAGRVYITGRDGATVVIRHGSTFEVLVTNTLDDGFDASPAIVDGEIYLRGKRYLYSIGK